MNFPYILSTVLLCGLQLASALPASKSAGSAAINHVIQHTHEDSYYVRSDPSIYARGTPSCNPLTVEQVKTLPGWSKIQQYAKDTYGDGGVNIAVNPPEYPNAPAIVCMQDEPIPIQLQGSPGCTLNTGEVEGEVTGTTGGFHLAFQQGYSNAATWTVTKESSLAVGVELSATIGIPEIAEVSTSITTTTTLTNSLSKSFTTTTDNQQMQTVDVATVDGKPCKGSMQTKTCNVRGTGSARFIASGSVWFNYEDKRPPKSDPNGDQHYKYAVDISSVLTNIDDRSSSMAFSGGMQITSQTHFDAQCS